MKHLLLLSNSTNVGEPYLGWPRQYIKDFYNKVGVDEILFIPYAGVNLSKDGLEASFDIYEQKVATVFNELGLKITSIHKFSDPIKAVREAKSIAVGGGNTFHLVYMVHKLNLMKEIKARVEAGMPFSGWSAGSNIACPTLRTTNDMPIIQPLSFDCLNLIPFQINPHYLDVNPVGHGGETRQQRIEEFMAINREVKVIGLREATLLEVEGNSLKLKGNHNLVVFEYDKQPKEYSVDDNLDFLLS